MEVVVENKAVRFTAHDV